jgi:hypothetical protein
MIATEINILPWYESLQLQHHNKRYAYGQYYCMPTPAGFLLPFQMRRPASGAAVSALQVISVATGASTDILALATAGGLEVAQYTSDGYDLIIYPATLAVGSFPVGRHYLRMVEGGNTWYSEVFNFVDTTAGLVKVEWWHNGDFCYPAGRVRYQFPYKGRAYFKTDIGKPEYTFEQVVSERNGKNFKLKQISAKQYKFVFLAPEYIADAFRQVPLHDFVQITNHNDGRVYDVDEINMGSPDWQDRGDLAAITVDFQTDTVIVKSGSGVTTLDYTPQPGQCLPVDYEVTAEILDGSAAYNGGYYISEFNGNQIPFEAGDYVIVTEDAPPYRRLLFEYDGSGYTPVSPAEDEIAYDANSGVYFFYRSDQFVLPEIISYTNGILLGDTYPNTLINIYTYDPIALTSELVETITSDQLIAGYPITFPPGTLWIYFEVATAACPALHKSDFLQVGDGLFGVDYDTIGAGLIVY